MPRSLLYFLLCLLVSCTSERKDIAEPENIPHILKPAKYVSAKGEIIKADSASQPKQIPVKSKYIEAGKPRHVFLNSNYQTAGKPKIMKAKARVVDMESVFPPKRFSTKGMKIPPRWSKWRPAQLDHEDNSLFAYLGVAQGLSSPIVFCLMEDHYGRIWIGHSNGTLSVWDGSGLVHYTEKEGFNEMRVNCLLEDRNGNIWIGTDNDGFGMVPILRTIQLFKTFPTIG